MKKVQHYINGKFMDSSCGEFFDNYNPATAELISKVALGREPEVNAAIDCLPADLSVNVMIFSCNRDALTFLGV